MEEYTSKAVTTTIRATSRASIKVRDNFYTVEYSEERALPVDMLLVDLEKEKQLLWDDVNAEVDAQIEDIIKSFSSNQR